MFPSPPFENLTELDKVYALLFFKVMNETPGNLQLKGGGVHFGVHTRLCNCLETPSCCLQESVQPGMNEKWPFPCPASPVNTRGYGREEHPVAARKNGGRRMPAKPNWLAQNVVRISICWGVQVGMAAWKKPICAVVISSLFFKEAEQQHQCASSPGVPSKGQFDSQRR